MGDKSRIEWTDATWNPVTGCSHVSEGCRHCYAETLSLRRGWTKKPWTAPNAAENVVLHPERLDQPLRWRRPRRIFVNSMSDLFHERIPDDFIDHIFAVMARSSQHRFQVLTKRPARMLDYFRGAANGASREVAVAATMRRNVPGWPLPNVWLGVSVEDQQTADERIPLLLETPAAVRFLSVEPLLGPVTFRWAKWQPLPRGQNHNHLDGLRRLGWVIVGGESGSGARKMGPGWVHAIRNECVEAKVPFFFKQWGGRTPKANGRLLDGREWNEMPDGDAEATG